MQTGLATSGLEDPMVTASAPAVEPTACRASRACGEYRRATSVAENGTGSSQATPRVAWYATQVAALVYGRANGQGGRG